MPDNNNVKQDLLSEIKSGQDSEEKQGSLFKSVSDGVDKFVSKPIIFVGGKIQEDDMQKWLKNLAKS